MVKLVTMLQSVGTRTLSAMDAESRGTSRGCVGARKRHSDQTQSLKISIQIEDQSVSMEIDTGARLSLVSEATYREKWPDKSLEQSGKKLYSYSGEAIPVLGSMTVGVTYKSHYSSRVSGQRGGPSLFGRNWLNHTGMSSIICILVP